MPKCGKQQAGRADVRKTIEGLVAEAAIRDLQTRYCRTCDRVDFDALPECFHPDATTE